MQPSSRNKFVIVAAVVVAVLVGVVFVVKKVSGSSAPSGPTSDMPLVSVAPPAVGPITTTVSINGTISARNELPLGIDTDSGRVAAVYVDVGDRIKRGQRLAVLDKSVIGPQTARLEASLAQATAEADLAQADWDRAQGVAASGALSKEAIEQRRAKLATTQAQVKVASAQLEETRARLERTEIRAPSDGLVLARNAEVGQIVTPGGEPLFRLAQSGEVELRGKVAEQDLPRLSVGQAVAVHVAGVEKPFEGKVRLIGAVIDPATRLGEVRVALATDPNLRPGAFGRGEVTISEASRMVVPQTAIMTDKEGTFVFIVGADEVVARRPVRVSDTTAHGVIVSEGLEGTERIVTVAGPFLRIGEKVKVDKAAS